MNLETTSPSTRVMNVPSAAAIKREIEGVAAQIEGFVGVEIAGDSPRGLDQALIVFKRGSMEDDETVLCYPPQDAADKYALVGLLFDVLRAQGRKPSLDGKIDVKNLFVDDGQGAREKTAFPEWWGLLARAVCK